MIYGSIHTWFPKSIYVASNVLLDKLDSYEITIKQIIADKGTDANGMLSVKSTHKIDDQLHTREEFVDLVNYITVSARHFLVELGYTNILIDVKIANMWANISHENDFIFPHVHANSLLSGAFYIKKYPDSKISFFNDIESIFPEPNIHNELNYPFCEYDCDPGRLMIWKSNFLHGTSRQTSGEKIVISFNISV
jgi:uncharacterized protein (TIGR02466 family)